MNLMGELDKATFDYSVAHNKLAGLVEVIEDENRAVQRRWHSALRKAVEEAAAKKAEVRALIDGNRGLFKKPKTCVLNGVRVGLMKGKGEIVIDNAEQTIKLIHKHLADVAEQLIITRESVSKSALAFLPAADLKRIGARVEETGDQIVIKPTDSEVDKLVDALLCESDEPEAA